MLIYTQKGEIVNFNNYCHIDTNLFWSHGRCRVEIRACNDNDWVRLGLISESMTDEEQNKYNELNAKKNKLSLDYAEHKIELKETERYDEDIQEIVEEVEYRAMKRANDLMYDLFMHIRDDGWSDMKQLVRHYN